VRRLLFAAIVIVLLASLLLLGLGNGGTHAGIRSNSLQPAAVSRPAAGNAAPADPAARVDARRFLEAFLALEAGDDTARTRLALRSTSGLDLASRILAASRSIGRARSPLAARLLALRLHRLPGHPGLLLASGTAGRPEGPEPFSFLFARRRGGWLAIAPGE
jgi:hypothetical protein